MPLKIAISGKGGVGKTTLAALLARSYALGGWRVVAVDADPASSLPAALGVSVDVRREIIPLSDMLDVIEERTGARPGGGYGGMFSLNPRVDDLVDRYAVEGMDGIRVMVLGTIKGPGTGCFCPESALLKNLMSHLILDEKHVVIVDMEAGLEHLGRSTARSMDALLVVVEPGRRSVETAVKIADMARSLGIQNVLTVINKVDGEAQEREIRLLLEDGGLSVSAIIGHDPGLAAADLAGKPVMSPGASEAIISLRKHMDGIISKGAAESPYHDYM